MAIYSSCIRNAALEANKTATILANQSKCLFSIYPSASKRGKLIELSISFSGIITNNPMIKLDLYKISDNGASGIGLPSLDISRYPNDAGTYTMYTNFSTDPTKSTIDSVIMPPILSWNVHPQSGGILNQYRLGLEPSLYNEIIFNNITYPTSGLGLFYTAGDITPDTVTAVFYAMWEE